ncbi:hypothetical protein TNCV_1027921 [Trichonephila clavipes]|nr:hypothetical protein TNCV_1027921 [Trichonephila clavipes]
MEDDIVWENGDAGPRTEASYDSGSDKSISKHVTDEISLQSFSSFQNMLLEHEHTFAGDVSTLRTFSGSHQPKHPSEHANEAF